MATAATIVMNDQNHYQLQASSIVEIKAALEEKAIETAYNWAKLIRPNLQNLCSGVPIDEKCYTVPRKGIADRTETMLAARIAEYVYPTPTNSYSCLEQEYGEASIQPPTKYKQDISKLRARIEVQRQERVPNSPIISRKRTSNQRVYQQGPWDEEHDPLSLSGAAALPMPVEISDIESLEPFFTHIRANGNHKLERAEITKEPYYDVEMAEFNKGVLYADGRMDLCKKVLGPPNIGDLMDSLDTNLFIKHFLLGNNIIGPAGARHIAFFAFKYPHRIKTWYLAGNCIDAASLKHLVDSWVNSASITNIWLKRNPLGPDSILDLCRLIECTPNLRTLDLDQTELGNAGVADLFRRLEIVIGHNPNLALRNIYLNGTGIGENACMAISQYLSHESCLLESLYISNNPIGDKGCFALAEGLKNNLHLVRLCMSSCGLKNAGVSSLLLALTRLPSSPTYLRYRYRIFTELNMAAASGRYPNYGHPTLKYLDLSQSFATIDLGSRYNYLSNGLEGVIVKLFKYCFRLQGLKLGITAFSHSTLDYLASEAATCRRLVFYDVTTFRPKPTGAVKSSPPLSRLPPRLLRNMRSLYGDELTWKDFEQGEMRFLRSPRDVRFIDSVYRNRDMTLARRGLMRLKKWWGEEDEGVLEDVMRGGQGVGLGRDEDLERKTAAGFGPGDEDVHGEDKNEDENENDAMEQYELGVRQRGSYM